MTLLAAETVAPVLLDSTQFYTLLAMQVLILTCMFAGFRRIGRNQQQLDDHMRRLHEPRED